MQRRAWFIVLAVGGSTLDACGFDATPTAAQNANIVAAGGGNTLDPNASPQPTPTTNAPTGGGNVPAESANEANDVACPLGQQPNGYVGGPSTCCSGDYTVCDNFEAEAAGGQPNAVYWAVEKLKEGFGPTMGSAHNDDTAAVVEVSDVRAARGKKSLHVRVPNDGWHHDMVVNRSSFPAPNNTFWGRAFVYYVSDASSGVPGGHSTFLDASGSVHGDKTFYTWWRASTFPNLGLNCEHGDASVVTGQAMPTNRWVCLEWHFQGDASNQVALYLDGNLLAHTSKTTETLDNAQGAAPVYDAFRLGYEVYGARGSSPKTFEMYYDEVVLAPKRVGCAN